MALMCSVWVTNSAGVIEEAGFTGSTIVHAKKPDHNSGHLHVVCRVKNATVCTPSELQNNSFPFVLLSTECILSQTDILTQALLNSHYLLSFHSGYNSCYSKNGQFSLISLGAIYKEYDFWIWLCCFFSNRCTVCVMYTVAVTSCTLLASHAWHSILKTLHSS